MTEKISVPTLAATPPSYAYDGDAGADLRSADSVTLGPGERRTVATGVSIAVPEGYAGFVVPRSGLADRHGITIVNAPGTIDSGYRGELRVTLLNTDRVRPYEVHAGDRIAQVVIVPVARARFERVERLSETARGTAGFGSTGDRAMTTGESA